jgi:leucyl aminopeptidase
MKFTLAKGSLESFKADIVAIACFEQETKKGEKPKPASLLKEDGGQTIDRVLHGEISKLMMAEEFSGAEGKTKLLFTAGLIPARYVVLVGLGRKKELSLDTLRKAGSAIVKLAEEVKARSVAAVFQKEAISNLNTMARMQSIVEGMLLGYYVFDCYKKEEDRKKKTLEAIHFLVSGNSAPFKKAIDVGSAIAEATNLARNLGNTPPIDMTPTILARGAREIATKYRLSIEVMGLKQIQTEKMGAFLSIAKSSAEPPVFIHLQYRPTKKAKAKVALVGKGVTFDAGGISLKPTRQMEHMKDDMGGASAVLGAMQAVALLKPQVMVDAYIPACENMPAGNAIKPGDVVRARNGKTIEIISADAEGRMILADALCYAVENGPDYVIDVATLTGTCAYAVGERYIAVLGNDQKLIDRLRKSGERAGEPLWQLPLEKDYKKGLTKGIADLQNLGSSKADTIAGALFLQEFVGETKWAHLDIASTSWIDEDLPYAPKGSTGAGVRILLNFLMSL